MGKGLNFRRLIFLTAAALALICGGLILWRFAAPVPSDYASPPDLEEVLSGYTAEDAVKDRCVVIDNSTLISGGDIWLDFVNRSSSGIPADVRVYQSYSDQNSNYYVKDLSFDGVKYNLTYYDRTGDTGELFLYSDDFAYLVQSQNTSGEALRDEYFLSDDPDISSDKFWRSIASSTFTMDSLRAKCRPIYSVTVD